MKNNMEEVIIYKHQLQCIIHALTITSYIHDAHECKTCHSRQVTQALQYAKNVLEGNKDIKVNYITGKNRN